MSHASPHHGPDPLLTVPRRAACALLAAFVVASPAHAVDRVAEIHHECAVHTGCFPGDKAGYPVTIDGSAGNSYRLTSDLVVPDVNVDGVVVSHPRSTIDLNGFQIVRSGCEGAITSCSILPGSGDGVTVSATNVPGVAVSNGTVAGMGSYGVLVGPNGIVSNLRVQWAGFRGISAGQGSSVSGNVVFASGGDAGVFARNGSTVTGNTAYRNGSAGIKTGPGCTISGNTSYDNEGPGIEASFGSSVQNNMVRLNSGYGLDLGATAAYRENVITSNAGGTVNGGVDAGDNFCDDTLDCDGL